jgi:hypothetical protein
MSNHSQRIESPGTKLRDLCKSLDECVRDIVEIPLQPTEELKSRIGMALARKFDAFDAIYVQRPDLKTEWLDTESGLQ